MSATVLVFGSRKGGVGKTKVTTNIGAELAGRDHRVLLIDLDPQGTTTADCGVKPELGATIGELINSHPSYPTPTLDEIIVSTEVANLDVLPALYQPLVAAERAMTGAKGFMTIAKNVVEPLRDRYDYILIDTPPSLEMLTTAAIHAADYAVPLVVPDLAAYEAAHAFLALVEDINSYAAVQTQTPFWIAANWEPGAEADDVIAQIAEDDLRLLETRLGHALRAASAPKLFAVPMVAVWPLYPFGRQVTALVDEILEVIA